MNILILTNSTSTTAGTGRNTTNIQTALKSQKHTVSLLCLKGSRVAFLKKIRIAARKVDVVYAIDINPVGYLGFFATRFLKTRFIIVAQAAYAVAPLHNIKTALLSKVVYRLADAVVAGSTFVADEIIKEVPNLEVTVIDPGIDMGEFFAVERSVETPPFILSVGAVKARKGHLFSLRAFAQAKKEFPELRYIIVGSQTDEPRYFKELQDLAHELGVAEDVVFLASISDEKLKYLYSRATLFILTSINIDFHFEGFGMVFLEAAAYGLPSVGTLGNGIADAIEDGETGLLVAQCDVIATSVAILRIVKDPQYAEKLSIRAKEFAREHDLSCIGKRYEDLHRQLAVQ
jgi:phosphatidylinositol alpha-1,6-mannosyltransferase